MLAACGSKKPAIRVYRHATYLGVWDRRYDSLVPGFNRIPPPDAISTFKVKYRNPEGILDITQEDYYILHQNVGMGAGRYAFVGCGTLWDRYRCYPVKGGVRTTIFLTHLISSFRTSLFANIQIIISIRKSICCNFRRNNSISSHPGW